MGNLIKIKFIQLFVSLKQDKMQGEQRALSGRRVRYFLLTVGVDISNEGRKNQFSFPFKWN